MIFHAPVIAAAIAVPGHTVCPHIMQAPPQLVTSTAQNGTFSLRGASSRETVRLAPPQGTLLGPLPLKPDRDGIATITVPHLATGTPYLVIVDGIVSGCGTASMSVGTITAP